MSHYDSFFPSDAEMLEEEKKRIEDCQKQCKHQWTMHEVTLEGSPVSVICMHCDKIHRIDNKTGGM